MIAVKSLSTVLGALGAASLIAAAASPAPQPAAAQVTLLHPAPVGSAAVSYASEIQPIFNRSCVNCHGGEDDGEPRLEAGLNLTSYDGVLAGSEFGSVVEAGDIEGSILFEMVEAGEMPEEGDPLSPAEIELLRNWIVEGAENN